MKSEANHKELPNLFFSQIFLLAFSCLSPLSGSESQIVISGSVMAVWPKPELCIRVDNPSAGFCGTVVTQDTSLPKVFYFSFRGDSY